MRRSRRNRFTYHMPLDPDCPDNPVVRFKEDPMTQYYGLGDDEEFTQPMEAKHLRTCERCREYALDNVEVQDR